MLFLAFEVVPLFDKVCLVYVVGDPADEAAHASRCEIVASGVRVEGFRDERVAAAHGDGRVLEVRRGDGAAKVARWAGDVGGAVTHDVVAADVGAVEARVGAAFEARGGVALLVYSCVLSRGAAEAPRSSASSETPWYTHWPKMVSAVK